MTDAAFDPDALIDALAPALGLKLSEESRAQVKTHLAIAANHAQTLLAHVPDDYAEPAPVFTP
jgi:Protein of unknown function (DUF4089)